MTFTILKRFFSPMKENPLMYIRGFSQWFLWASQWVIHVFFIQKITVSIEAKDSVLFYKVLSFYFWYIILYEILEHISKAWWWVEVIVYSQRNIAREYMKKFFTLDNTKVESIWTGKLVSILEKGIETWGGWLHDIIERGLAFTLVFFYVVYQLSINNVGLLITFLVFFIIIASLTRYINQKTLIERAKRREYQSLFTKQMVKMIMSKFEILQSKKSKQEIEVLDWLSDRIYESTILQLKYLQPFFRIPDFALWFSMIALCLFLWERVIQEDLLMSWFIGIITGVILMDKALDNFLKLYKDFTKELPDIERFWELFDTTPQISGYETWNTFSYKSWNIELQKLSYAYEGNKNVFENFDLKINWGKITAFVWPSGGGKSTLVKLIAGYLKADAGEILIDEQKLSETSLKSYYQSIGYLTQEPSVFDGTVRENLMYAIGEENIDETHLQNILALSRCEFISDLPSGLDTEIWERGVKLSGGQKQRLAIAKIFLKNPKIIMLDEPTSALDSQSEKAITQAMHQLFQNRTVLVIAHRLQTVKHADEIIVIDQGKIIERGNHQSLLTKKWYYAEMLELQSGF